MGRSAFFHWLLLARRDMGSSLFKYHRAASGLLEAVKERMRNGIPSIVPALPEKFSLLNSEDTSRSDSLHTHTNDSR